MCGHNMLKIDVKKTLENGEENGMIEESCNFFLLFSSTYFFFNFE